MLPPLTSLDDFRTQLSKASAADQTAVDAAAARNGQLTKPPGALGRLEDLAIWYGGWRKTDRPEVQSPQVIVFAGNHGVTAQGVSAFPAEVTAQMVINFEHGGAAINQLAKLAGARMDVHALDLETPVKDFTQAPAMSEIELLAALEAGWSAVDPTADLLVVGEMGIGNTTPAAALAHALYGGAAADWTGRGTGVDDAGLANKSRVVAEGVALHGPAIADGLDALQRLGGREIAAMAGAIAAARVLHIPVILDGFICCAAAACLQRTSSTSLDHAIAGHQSAESAHAAVLKALGKEPLLSLGLRLGEGSGAALAIQVLKGAIACHSGMATFAEAGVSDG
ncbi:Nicotinate-nucleotide--dimethylbenzimidazole phosphoribosyltransferase [Phaeobacter sp. CECT 5382]|uniref:nicotinate-nucleotide--dimethylbenzimidazole phosphoribosyltransferase n=1 Tax=Phaeobacter sp. CECT 5382 TaxID=1712645 RepID=UPI0006D9E98C|nr:nicotinate-nucleotide--dimethylbenzimidazole phosphoribosyltransferase [Phaeobacter sp. CECT 5382]CUH87916.1 Nicotinate-nucleotide--dimethylbenzimidazole phosphoribosyltransferase [Phaeobacter sp. CECT 5382]